MKRLPDINDEKAMLERGRRSAIGAARKDAAETLRDACTMCQSSEWAVLSKHARDAAEAAERLLTLAAMWEEMDVQQE